MSDFRFDSELDPVVGVACREANDDSYPFDGIVGEDPEPGLDTRLQTLTPVHRLLIVEGDPAPGVHGGLSPGLAEADGGGLTPDASAGRVGEPGGPPVIF